MPHVPDLDNLYISPQAMDNDKYGIIEKMLKEHSTYCNCKGCCTQFEDLNHLSKEEFRYEMIRRGIKMFGEDSVKKWSKKEDIETALLSKP